MELTAQIAALEEEVTVLKGEIKAILQEVRTAVLARDNPFTGSMTDSLPTPSLPTPPGFAEPSEPRATPADAGTHRSDEAHEAPRPRLLEAVQHANEWRIESQRTPRRWSIQRLATLMVWTQDTAARMSEPDLSIVLSLARYGGMIETDLEETLLELAGALATDEAPRRAGVNDFLLALRQLDAILRDEDEGTSTGQSLRQAG